MDLFRLASGKMENFWDDQVLVREKCIKHLMKADNADTDYDAVFLMMLMIVDRVFLNMLQNSQKTTAAAIPLAALSCSQNLASGFGLESCKIVKRSENCVK